MMTRRPEKAGRLTTDALVLLCFGALLFSCRNDASKARHRHHQEHGEELMKKGRFARAEHAFKQALKADPKNLETWRRLAEAQLGQGKANQAADSLSMGLRKGPLNHPSRYPALLELAGALRRQGKDDLAVGVLDRARKLKPDLPKAYLELAALYMANKQPDIARALFKMITSRLSGTKAAEILMIWAGMEIEAGKKEDAIVLLRRALGKAGADNKLKGRILLLLGDLKLSEKKYADAVTYLERAVRLDGSSGTACSRLGEALKAMGLCKKAVEPLRKAVAALPRDPRSAVLLAFCLAESEDPTVRSTAYGMAVRAHTLDPNDIELKLLLARLNLEQGLPGPALDLLDHPGLVKAKKDNPAYWRLKGEVESELGNHRTALSHLSTSLALDPRNPSTLRLHAVALRKAGSYSMASTSIEELLKSNAADYELWVNLALCQEHLGKRSLAVKSLQQATGLKPERPEAWVYLGWIALRAGRYAEAEKHAKKGISLGPRYRIHALDVLFQVQDKTRRFKEALSTARKALALARSPSQKQYLTKAVEGLSRKEASSKGKPSTR